MYATGAGTPSMIARNCDSRAARASCATLRSVMSWPTTYSPRTDPSRLRSGTHRAIAIGRQRLRALDAKHLLGLLAEHFVAREAIKIEERLVDEHVVAFGVQ